MKRCPFCAAEENCIHRYEAKLRNAPDPYIEGVITYAELEAENKLLHKKLEQLEKLGDTLESCLLVYIFHLGEEAEQFEKDALSSWRAVRKKEKS